MSKGAMAAVSVVLGACVWGVVGLLGPGPTPLQSGALYMAALGAAGFLVALVQRELRWESLLGIYAGQGLAFAVQALLGHSVGDEPVAFQPLFLLSANLSAAVGGVVGAVAARALRGSTTGSASQ